MKQMVGDDLKVHEFCQPYVREGKRYCCGHEVSFLDGFYACPYCTSEYEKEDFDWEEDLKK